MRRVARLVRWAPLLLVWPAIDYWRWHHTGRSPFNPPHRTH